MTQPPSGGGGAHDESVNRCSPRPYFTNEPRVIYNFNMNFIYRFFMFRLVKTQKNFSVFFNIEIGKIILEISVRNNSLF